MENYEVRDHLPLKQGLRHRLIKTNAKLVTTCQRPSSTKTRIKTIDPGNRSGHLRVRDHLPLKQGLRLGTVKSSSSIKSCVRDHLPLKQGLRPAGIVTLVGF